MRGFLCFFSSLIFSVSLYTQDTIIEFDRPGAADLPYLVPQKTLQIEVGYGFTADDSALITFDRSPGILLRYSPFRIFELRFAINYLPMATHFSRSYDLNNAFGFGIGGKFKICHEKGLRPELAVEGLFTFSDQTFSNSGRGPVGGEIYFLSNHFLSNWFYWNYNIGYIYGGPQLQHTFTYSSCFGFIAHRYVEFFAEQFSFFHSHDIPDFGMDAGICVYPTPSLQIDLSYIRLFNGFGNQNILNLGLSYNIGFTKHHLRNLYWQ